MTKFHAYCDQGGLLSLSSLVSVVCKSTCIGLLIAQATLALPAPTIRPLQEAVERDLATKVIHGGDDAVWDFFARSGFFPEAVAARAMQKENRGFEGYESLWANFGARDQGPHDYKPVEPVEPGNPRSIEDDESKQHYEHSQPNPGHNGRDLHSLLDDRGAHDHKSPEPIIDNPRDIEADGMRQHYEPPHADPGHGERDLHTFVRDQGPHDHKSPEPIDGPEGRSFQRDQGPHYYKPVEPGHPPAVESADGSHNLERRSIARDQGPHDHEAPHAKPGPGNGDPPAVEVDGARSSHSSPEIQPPSGPWIGRSTRVWETDGNRHYPTDPKKQPGSAPWHGGRALASPEDVIVVEREDWMSLRLSPGSVVAAGSSTDCPQPITLLRRSPYQMSETPASWRRTVCDPNMALPTAPSLLFTSLEATASETHWRSSRETSLGLEAPSLEATASELPRNPPLETSRTSPGGSRPERPL